MNEPMCCGTPMVHNSFTGEHECADAYFGLVDDGLFEDGEGFPDRIPDDISAEHRALWEHWRDSVIPDGGAS